MLILEGIHLKKFFGERPVLDIEHLRVYSGDRLGIVGENGAGKTTLLNILAGDLRPDEGTVHRYGDIVYIRQFSNEISAAHPKLLKEFGVLEKTSSPQKSGGERARIKIANAMSQDGLLWLVDEPTANLDLEGSELVKKKLAQIESLIVVSHDRHLLDFLCNRIIEIKNTKIKRYEGNYSFYRAQSQKEIERHQFEYQQYLAEKNRLQQAIVAEKTKARSIRKAPRRMGNSEARLHRRSFTETQAKFNQSASRLTTRLQKLPIVEKPFIEPDVTMDFCLGEIPENKQWLVCEGLCFSHGNRTLFRDARFSLAKAAKTALIGKNGSGKSTLLNLIYGRHDAVRIAPRVRLGYFHQDFDQLDPHKTILENVLAESIQSESTVRTILARLRISGDAVHKSVAVLSGGERVKVALAKLLSFDANLLLLDEPTNYLDTDSLEALEHLLQSYPGSIVLVSHDQTFIDAIADRLWIIEDEGITAFNGNLTAYQARRSQVRQTPNSDDAQKTLLKMKLTEIIAKLELPGADREILEAEYQRTLTALKTL